MYIHAVFSDGLSCVITILYVMLNVTLLINGSVVVNILPKWLHCLLIACTIISIYVCLHVMFVLLSVYLSVIFSYGWDCASSMLNDLLSDCISDYSSGK